MELIQQDRARQGAPVNNGDNPLVGTVSINLPIWVESRNAAVREAEHRKQGYREQWFAGRDRLGAAMQLARITSYNVCYTKLLRSSGKGAPR